MSCGPVRGRAAGLIHPGPVGHVTGTMMMRAVMDAGMTAADVARYRCGVRAEACQQEGQNGDPVRSTAHRAGPQRSH